MIDVTRQSGPTNLVTFLCEECRGERRKRYDVMIGQIRFTLCEDDLKRLYEECVAALEGEKS